MDQCGQAKPPVGAGPWVRADGIPFAAKIEDALDAGKVYSPLNIDEFGHAFYTYAQSFTATGYNGTFNVEFGADGDCEKWTSSTLNPSDAFPALGSNLGAADYWTFDDSGVSCDGTRRLMCLQRNSGEPLTGHSQFGHREAFVSSIAVTGNMGGLVGADNICRSLAVEAGLYQPDSFKALLAASATNTTVPDRIEVDGPWYRRDGLLFAHDKMELIHGAVTLPLNVTEFGEYIRNSVALTGSESDGLPYPNADCGSWTLDQGLVSGSIPNMVAFAPSGGHEWLDVTEVTCKPAVSDEYDLRLYCLSDADVLFHDGMDELRPDL
jgi:hypothetical protein